MADGIDFDFTDLTRLGADVGDIPREAAPLLRKAIEVSGFNVRDSWRDRLKGSPTIPAGGASITYDIKGGQGIRGSQLEAEIGPELGRPAASLVGITEVGAPEGQAPRNYGPAALHDNEADFEFGVRTAIDDALKGLGL